MKKKKNTGGEIAKQAADLIISNQKLVFQNEENVKLIAELALANIDKAKRVAELVIANEEKSNRRAELDLLKKELIFQNQEKAKRVEELVKINQDQAERATELAVALEANIVSELINTKLKSTSNEKLKQSLMETINIASQLIELRDPYTAGHENHVGDLASAVAKEMGLDDARQEGLMVAGYLHDLGKIIVPMEILCKPEKISDEEYNLIKNHVQASYDLLRNVSLPWPVAKSVLEHHERLDGSGYPNGLKGDQISLEGRILAVSDVVDAMVCNRPYRAAPGIEKALAELEGGRSTIYDEKVVDACLRLFHEKSYVLSSALV